MNHSDKSLVVFKAIVNFVKDCSEEFADKQHSLKLYNHLIEKTTLGHEKAINKHIEAFTEFCVSNRDCILSKSSELVKTDISYSEKCYINMEDIFSRADKDSEDVIWKHLLFLSALVDPEAKAKEVLKKDVTNEGNFLNKILGKVEREVEGKDNPMEAISSVLQSGVFNEVISDMNEGFKSGDLDLSKMMGTMQNIMGNLPQNQNGPSGMEGIGAMSSMLTNLMGNGGQPGSTPDLGSLISSMSSMMPPVPSNTESAFEPSSIEDDVE